MRGEGGFTLVELLVAASLALALTALTCAVLADARTAADVVAGRADAQQRSRIALQAVASRLRSAGAGDGPVGSLWQWAPVLPGRPGAAAAELGTGVTTLEMAAGVAPARLAAPATAAAAALDLAFEPGCAAPCGFVERMAVMLVNADGDFDVFVLAEPGGAPAAVRHVGIGTAGRYEAGATALAIDVRAYYFRPSTRELRSFDGDRSDLPVVNDVVGAAFEYFAVAAGGGFERLSLDDLGDGPWRGSGAAPYDADLRRIRLVRFSLRVQAADERLRGADARWFRHPGTAVRSGGVVRDVTVSGAAAPRNAGALR